MPDLGLVLWFQTGLGSLGPGIGMGLDQLYYVLSNQVCINKTVVRQALKSIGKRGSQGQLH